MGRGIWGRVDGFDFTVLKHRKIKTFQGNNFTVSSALVIKLKVVVWRVSDCEGFSGSYSQEMMGQRC